MRAKELWRLAPRIQTRTEPKRVSAVPPGLVPPELQAKMVAAFERARAERLAAQIPVEEAHGANDPQTRANTAAFLVLERERRVVAARLARPLRRPAHRYRDLILVTKLIQVQYEHLAGRVGARPGSPSPSNGLPDSGDRPADWARPWGSGPMVEMGTALSFYQDQCDHLARRLPSPSLGRAAAAAAGHRDRILKRFEKVKGGRLGQEALSAPESERRRAWVSARLTKRAAAVAGACATVGLGAMLAQTRNGESVDIVSAPSRAVAIVPEALAAIGERPLEPPQAGSRADGGSDPAPAVTDEVALTTAQAPRPAPERDPYPAPAPVAPVVPVAAPAPPPPPPPAPEPQPDSNPQPNPKPQPGPVSSLPPPVGSLPPPQGSGAGE